MLKNKENKTEKFENYDLSISDLMSGLCGVFLLFLSIAVLQLNKQRVEYKKKNEVAQKYIAMQEELYDDLLVEFRELKKKNIEITPDLTFHFKDVDVLFNKDSAALKAAFKSILQDFFPRLIKILSSKKYKNAVEEIRIEGHTARNPLQNKAEDYKSGMLLSQERVMNVLLYCIENIPLSSNKKKHSTLLEWVRRRIIAAGFSNSHPVKINNIVDNASSRRVEIKIKTKAESVINSISKLGKEEPL